MLLQVLLSVVLIALLAGALLASALVNVKVAAQQAVVRITGTALARGTDEFVNWAQDYVAQRGAATTWPSTPVTDQPQAACATTTACNTFATIVYGVVGSSAAGASGPDPAQNLQSALHENRISGTVTATITDQNGTIIGSRTRLVTVRIFDAPPFAALSGARDVSTIAGSAQAGQGDTAGYRDPTIVNFRATPNPAIPANVKDTSITVTMSCTNSSSNNDQTNPLNDNHQPGNDSEPWGVSGGTAFEAPCTPTYSFSATPPIPTDAYLSTGNVYEVGSFSNTSWTSTKGGAQGWSP